MFLTQPKTPQRESRLDRGRVVDFGGNAGREMTRHDCLLRCGDGTRAKSGLA
ncbi:hypothetical protein RRSWK_01240 [Rhodopirellula sp. SWK7]|nr:hypothetical protein RRSWK_01240 [Rhodopirellula sp. SWK7]